LSVCLGSFLLFGMFTRLVHCLVLMSSEQFLSIFEKKVKIIHEFATGSMKHAVCEKYGVARLSRMLDKKEIILRDFKDHT
jgi:hypothetical protein